MENNEAFANRMAKTVVDISTPENRRAVKSNPESIGAFSCVFNKRKRIPPFRKNNRRFHWIIHLIPFPFRQITNPRRIKRFFWQFRVQEKSHIHFRVHILSSTPRFKMPLGTISRRFTKLLSPDSTDQCQKNLNLRSPSCAMISSCPPEIPRRYSWVRIDSKPILISTATTILWLSDTPQAKPIARCLNVSKNIVQILSCSRSKPKQKRLSEFFRHVHLDELIKVLSTQIALQN